jgi:hypothetical protein
MVSLKLDTPISAAALPPAVAKAALWLYWGGEARSKQDLSRRAGVSRTSAIRAWEVARGWAPKPRPDLLALVPEMPPAVARALLADERGEAVPERALSRARAWLARAGGGRGGSPEWGGWGDVEPTSHQCPSCGSSTAGVKVTVTLEFPPEFEVSKIVHELSKIVHQVSKIVREVSNLDTEVSKIAPEVSKIVHHAHARASSSSSFITTKGDKDKREEKERDKDKERGVGRGKGKGGEKEERKGKGGKRVQDAKNAGDPAEMPSQTELAAPASADLPQGDKTDFTALPPVPPTPSTPEDSEAILGGLQPATEAADLWWLDAERASLNPVEAVRQLQIWRYREISGKEPDAALVERFGRDAHVIVRWLHTKKRRYSWLQDFISWTNQSPFWSGRGPGSKGVKYRSWPYLLKLLGSKAVKQYDDFAVNNPGPATQEADKRRLEQKKRMAEDAKSLIKRLYRRPDGMLARVKQVSGVWIQVVTGKDVDEVDDPIGSARRSYYVSPEELATWTPVEG